MTDVEQAIAKLRAEVAAASKERHVISFDHEDGWGLQHPIRCLPDLLDCLLHKRLTEDPDHIWDVMRELDSGRYWAQLDDEHNLEVEDEPVKESMASHALKTHAPDYAACLAQMAAALELIRQRDKAISKDNELWEVYTQALAEFVRVVGP